LIFFEHGKIGGLTTGNLHLRCNHKNSLPQW